VRAGDATGAARMTTGRFGRERARGLRAAVASSRAPFERASVRATGNDGK